MNISFILIQLILPIFLGFLAYLIFKYLIVLSKKDRSYSTFIGFLTFIIVIIVNVPNMLLLALSKQLGFNIPSGSISTEDKFIILVIGVLGLIGFMFYQRKRYLVNNQSKTQIFDKNELDFVQTLKEQYTSRLHQKIDNRITLPITYKNAENIQLEEILATQICIFITGKPGIGKTTELVKLSIELIENENFSSIPIILNLATWSKKYENFQDWIEDYLYQAYFFPKKEISHLIASGKLVFLLDGLDELARNKSKKEQDSTRLACYTSILTLIKETPSVHLIITCRKDEYNKMRLRAKKLHLKLNSLKAYELISPTKEMISKAIIENHGEYKFSNLNAQNTFVKLLENTKWREVIEIPFYFNIATKIFEDNSVYEKGFLNWEKAEIKAFLVQEYTNNRISDLHSDSKELYGEENIEKYLAWLAFAMDDKNSIEFDLTFFQPNLLEESNPKSTHLPVETDEDFSLNFSKLLNVFSDEKLITKIIFYGFLICMIQSYAFISMGKIDGFSFLCIGMGMFFILCESLEVKEVKHFFIGKNDTPYLKFRFIRLNFVFFSGYFMLGSVIVTGIKEGQSWVAIAILTVVSLFLIFLVLRYTSPYYRHLTVMYNLGKETKVPSIFPTKRELITILFRSKKANKNKFDYPYFLNLCVKHRILEINGGKWRFKHDLIRDYFVNNYKK